MILTLILAIGAGYAARPAEPRITEILSNTLGRENLPEGAARQVAALLVTMFLAAVLLWVLDAEGRPAIFVLGAAIGYFQAELREAINNRKA